MQNSKEFNQKSSKQEIAVRLVPESRRTHQRMIDHGNHPRFEL